MAFSPDKRLVATGEIGPKPIVCIWDACTRQVVHKIKGKLQKGIQRLCFSPSGNSLVAVATDTDHHVAIIDVKSGSIRAIQKGDQNRIIDVAMDSEESFATMGPKHYKYWGFSKGNLKGKRGTFKKKQDNKVCSGFAFEKYILAGTKSG